ncbi:hypothetical protein CHLRE_03g165750v5 [Chlamydomonas reinhardtii]|uniref:DNA-directed RNA polymerase subunit n=1 Tax=Chlamydomonas reinhardtii TaxID=3055 RepID=A0A2K3DWQ1_CHLRE|nr:uncharacterized protein CHLRE_03g165750v5 [Chlamydomonas reinhardtii]PNW84960.1 hypothetical protein CHLRE_03g165750v5 [Chlamydomonas reinhardtii]
MKHVEQKKEQPAPLVCTKDPYKEQNLPRKIQQISFGVQTPQEIVKCGVLQVYERALYKMPERVPAANGVLDRRLGVSNKNYVCETCGHKLADCAGHFGYIKLELPVFHIGYFKNTVQILQCICKACSRVLLPDEERRVWLKRFRNPRVERVQRGLMFRKLNDRCKRQRNCPYCGEYNATVKKASGALKIVHERFAKNVTLFEEYKETLSDAMKYNDQLKGHLHRLADDLHPLRVRALFEAIPDEDLDLLDIQGRPEDLVVTHVAVPPVAIRPSVEMDGASNEDDITMKLMQIIEVNNVLRQGLEKGLPISNLMENWDFLQVQAAMLINSDLPGLPAQFQMPGRPLRGFVQRLKGKQGRFRGNLSGKRVDFSGRTVISPDPNLQIFQVCVPQHMAVVLTYPERVTRHNVEKLRQRVLNGISTWPGANFVVTPDGDKQFLKFGDRRKIASELKMGYIVERHLEDGDVVLFNRQPSLHRISIMAFRAKVRTWRTLRFNECACSPFNADFDGDEMNLHLPQTEEARAEANNLMGSVHNLATPKNGDIMIHATQDFLTCAFLLTSKDRFYSRAEFCGLLATMADGLEHIDIPTPALIKPLELWTGKQLFSCLVRPAAGCRVFVNLEMAEKVYTKKGEHMCPNDGWVCFRNSELISGRLGKVVLGGSKSGLFGTLNCDYSPYAAASAMSRLAKMAARHMGNRGFSIGIDDVTPAPVLEKAKAETVQKGYSDCTEFITAYRKGQLQLQPGCNAEQSLEANMTGVLNNIREVAGKVCMDTLDYHNSPLIMSQCGSKGSPINIAQMVACVGQQSVGGKRCFNGFRDRTLPHYPRGDKTPAGKGFVANSFYSGLCATEFWFHTMGGREGLVDTAVKTAETGYMSRRLMKALEDLYAHYDATVRNAAGGIVQLLYGEDGMDPVAMEGKDGKPLDFGRLMAKVRATTRRLPMAAGGATEVPLPAALEAAVAAQLARTELSGVLLNAAGQPEAAAAGGGGKAGKGGAGAGAKAAQEGKGGRGGGKAGGGGGTLELGAPWCSEAFRKGLKSFLEGQVAQYRAARKRLGLEEDARGAALAEYVAGQDGLTRPQLEAFVAMCLAKYATKRIDPGSTVGAVGAQSIGEPGTQMTLKTFHFAGVASMNVTLGVPRIKEIINAARTISTPIIKVALAVDNDVKAARLVKGRLEKTTLGQVARHIKIVLKPGRVAGGSLAGSPDLSPALSPGGPDGGTGAYGGGTSGPRIHGEAAISIRLDMSTIEALQLDIDGHTVKYSILAHPKLKLKEQHVRAVAQDKVLVYPPDASRQGLLFCLEGLLAKLSKVIVMGIPTVERAVITKEKGDKYALLVEGTNVQAVLGTLGVAGTHTTTNHISEIEKFMGIEAARSAIMSEIKYTMSSHGMSIDDRHIMLLADCMSYKGEVLGITRFGIAKMKDSVLHTASFEKTADHLFDAAIHGRVDDVVGVSESIIMGIPMPTGTGLFRIRHNVAGQVGALFERPLPLLSYSNASLDRHVAAPAAAAPASPTAAAADGTGGGGGAAPMAVDGAAQG